MGSIFISHSGKNNEKAKLVRDWLVKEGWSDVFLDIDPVSGLAPGQRWQEELRRAGERCAAVVVLVSPEWAASPWCKTEFLVAVQLGKKIFPLFVEKTPLSDLPSELAAHFQLADISDPAVASDGFERLSIGLKRAGLDPTHFPWPPNDDPKRSPYRGLAALEEVDAAVLFGRDAEIVRGLDALRRMREGSRERALVIVGVSGAGKSSFLRAGLLARLARDEPNFLALPAVRPGRAALTGADGFWQAMESARQQFKTAPPRTAQEIVALFAHMRAPVFDELKRHAAANGQDYLAPAPTMVIPIDQAEELFDSSNAEAANFLTLLSEAIALDGNAIVVATVRSESYSLLQADERLRALPHAPFDFAPPSPAAFKEVIVGPARLAKPPFEFKPDLVNRLVVELDDADALPLLAATLQRLYDECRTQGFADVAAYERLGGLSGTISRAADAAIAAAAGETQGTRDEIHTRARRAFIPWLVSMDFETGAPKRRVARLDEMPADTRPMIAHFSEARLLTIDRRMVDGAEGDVAEIVHEAVLRQWDALASWIAQERSALIQVESLRRSAIDWDRNRRGEAWLYHQNERLREADELLRRSDFAAVLGDVSKRYVKACREREERQLTDERTRLDREKRQVALTRRFQWIATFLLALVSAFAVFTVIKAFAIVRSENTRASIILAQLAEAASDRGAHDEAMRYAVSGLYGQDSPFIGYDGTMAQAALVRAANASRLLTIARADPEHVIQATFSRDGAKIATAGAGGAVGIFDAHTGEAVRTIQVSDGWVYTVQFSQRDDRILTASRDGRVQVWDLDTRRASLRLPETFASLRSAYFSNDGQRIVVAAGDTASIWTAEGAPVRSFQAPGETIQEAVLSRDGARLLAGTSASNAYVWDVVSGLRTDLAGHSGAVVSVAFSPDGETVATASSDRMVRLWNARTGAAILNAADQPMILSIRDDVLSCVRFSDDGARIATASNDGIVRIWSAQSGLELERFFVTTTDAHSVSFSPDGRRIVTGDAEGAAKVWSADQDVIVDSPTSVFSAVANEAGDRIVAAARDGRAHIFTMQGVEALTTGAHGGAVITAVYSPDERLIVTASADRRSAIWSASDGSFVRFLEGHTQGVLAAVFSPDGRLVATASNDGTARIYRVEDGAFLRALAHHHDAVVSVNFSPDSQFIITAGGDSVVRIWSARTFAPVRELRGNTQLVNDARYSPRGDLIATAADDGLVLLWEARGDAPPRRLEGHAADANSVAFSPDGALLATAGEDLTVRIWDVASGRELFRFEDYALAPRTVAFTADGRALLTAGRDNTVRLRSISGPLRNGAVRARALVAHVCANQLPGALRQMTETESATATQLMVGAPRDVCERRSGWDRLWEIAKL